ncbi:MAG: type I restriction-modification system endonuclease [Byssovorax sp.]
MVIPPSANFAYLGHHDPRLVAVATQAERLFADDANACLIKLRLFGELLAQRAAAKLGLYQDATEPQAALVDRLAARGGLNSLAANLFHDLRRAGNRAVHEGWGDAGEALHQLKMARELALWFQRAFGNNKKFDPGPFVSPSAPHDREGALADELARAKAEADAYKADAESARAARELLADELSAVQKAAREALPAAREAAVERVVEAGAAIQLSEADTRRIIDQQLRDAGWDADSTALTHAEGACPVKGKNQAISEWPSTTGPADYVLFAGRVALAVIEAKKQSLDVPEVLRQSARYAKALVVGDEAELPPGSPWERGARVPFLFATNGRPYLKQLETRSGIWFRDARKATNTSRAATGWHTPEGLLGLLKQDEATAHEKLAAEPTGYLDLRPYQIAAIHAVETAIGAGQRACLLAMATGTGKTRTAIGLIYRLLKSQRFRRILFLVDRTSLGDQTEKVLQHVRLENLQTFAEIYNVKGLGDGPPEAATRLQIATIQSMVRRILAPGESGGAPPVDAYDCVIVDECHRGYTLDQEMSELELGFRDQAEYASMYRRTLDHFDAVKIGLTATPALHTKEIFGAPVFLYSYREAVIDGSLVDHEPPVQIVTQLSEQGMLWPKGSKMRKIDPRKLAEELVDVEDEVKINVDAFNREVITESFNRVVCAELAKHIDPTLPTKTLIFCATDAHADLVVKELKAAFKAAYGEVDDDAVLKITGSKTVDRPLQKILMFKNELLPSVVVTVDLLTTGIDVPRIGNIVFLRRVKSRILFEQMLGRATRLCPEIDKTSFRVFDAVKLYEALEQVTSMVPVVTDVSLSFGQLVRELGTAPDQASRELVLEQLIAKLQRKRQTLKGEALSRFESLAEMRPEALARHLRGETPEGAARWFGDHSFLISFLEEKHALGRPMIVSDHEDQVISVERGYGKSKRPEDYLESFAAFIRENLNLLPALMVVTQRPRDLTRADLRALKLALDEKGFTDVALRTAWQERTSADVAASIIGFIRQAALGDALVPYATRVDRALVKITARYALTSTQRQWLTRIGKQLKIEEVVDHAAMDSGQFKDDGGFARFDKIFAGRLDELLGDLRAEIWEQAAG